MRIVPIEYAEDLYSSESIYDVSGKQLVKSGAALTKKALDTLRNHGVFSLYIHDAYSVNTLTPPIPILMKNELVRALYQLYESIRLQYESGKPVEETTGGPLEKIQTLAGQAQNQLLSVSSQILGYTDIKSTPMYTAGHCVNVAVLSFFVGRDLGLDKQKLTDLFLGSLFHDIGMNAVNESIIMKNGTLNMLEFMKIKKHPKIGHDIFEQYSFGTGAMRNMILNHHEKLDGSGYPNQLAANRIDELSKIVAVVDSYDAMTSDRPYSRAVAPFEAIRHLSPGSGIHFDASVMERFFRKLQPFPEGSLVRLSNGNSAVVVISNAGEPLRPVVIPISQKTKKMLTTPFDLSENMDVSISGILYDILSV